jgi:predicted dehydrogenase
LSEGTIGEARAVQGTLARQFLDPDDIRNKPGSGGALYDLGAYVISASNLVFGQAPMRVVAAIDRDPKFGIDRLSTALLDYGGRHATFSVGTQTGPAQSTHQQFSVLGDKGWLRLDFPYAHARPHDCHLFIGDENSMGAFESKTLSFEIVDQYRLQIERFSRVLRGEPAPSWPIEDSRSTLRTIEALFASALEGGWANVQTGTQ